MRPLFTVVAALIAVTIAVPVTAAPGVPADPQVIVEPGTGFSKAQVREIRTLVSEATTPTRVFILERLPRAAADSPDLHAEHLERARTGDGPGVTVVFSPGTIPEYGAFETVRRGEDGDVGVAVDVLDMIDGTPQEKFVELVRMATTSTGLQRLDEEIAKTWDDPELDPDTWGEDGLLGEDEPPSAKVRAARWLVIAGALLCVGVFVAFRFRAARGWWQRHRRAKGLEAAADRAEGLTLADQAKADVAAFGAAIDAERMDEHDALELWHLALDDYEQASTLLDRATKPAEHEKVIVICARGRARLASAQR